MYYAIQGLSFILVLALYLALRKSKSNESQSGYFKDKVGDPIPSLPEDTRFRRFTKGKEISDQGAKEFGDRPFLVRNGQHRELIISHPSHIKDFYMQDGADHKKLHDCNMGSFFARTLGSCVGVQNGAEWKNTRSHLDPHFSFTSANSVIETTKDAIKTWAETLPQEVGAGISGPFELDAIAACRQLPFRLIAMALYGEVFSEELFARLWDLNTLHEEVTFVTFLSPAAKNWWYAWLPTKANTTLRKFNQLWKELNLDAVALARKRGISIPLEGMYQAVEGGHIDMTSFLQSLDEIIFTNIDITSTIFAYCLINLASHPDEQNDLRNEILSKEKDIATLDRYLKEENTQLHHTYLELLRNNPPAWFSLPEMTAKDKYIGGYLIPAATPVIIDVRRLNQDSPIWAPDGKVFRPRRWDSVSRLDARYSLHGYGLGPRKCLGKNFASIMIKSFVITVLENYQLGGALDTKLRRDTWTRVPESVVSFEIVIARVL